MKRELSVLIVILAVRVGSAQLLQHHNATAPSMPGTNGAAAKADDVKLDGRCQVVRPGDVVHYELTIQAVGSAKFVDADIELHNGDWPHKAAGGLQFPDFRTLGGSSPAKPDASLGNVYHFQFVVPQRVLSGTYRGSAVFVTVSDDDDDLYNRNSNVPVNRPHAAAGEGILPGGGGDFGR